MDYYSGMFGSAILLTVLTAILAGYRMNKLQRGYRLCATRDVVAAEFPVVFAL